MGAHEEAVVTKFCYKMNINFKNNSEIKLPTAFYISTCKIRITLNNEISARCSQL